jgi:hypothetical protein
MAAESFFSRAANQVLQASEDMANRMEEGISVLMTGDLPSTKGAEQNGIPESSSSSNEQPGFDFDDLDLENLSEEELQKILSEEMMQHSPLEGIADSVIGDIFAGQVRHCLRYSSESSGLTMRFFQ